MRSIHQFELDLCGSSHASLIRTGLPNTGTDLAVRHSKSRIESTQRRTTLQRPRPASNIGTRITYARPNEDMLHPNTNEWTDASTGDVYLRARWYAPGQGRFLTKDTWEGDYTRPLSYNRWNYVESNPINIMDPTGQCYIDGQGLQCINNPRPIPPPNIKSYNEKIPPPGIKWIPSSNPLSSGAKGIPYGVNQAQFQVNPSWTGLCGPISVAAIIRSKDSTVTAQEVVAMAKDLIGDPNYLGADKLEELLEKFIYENYQKSWYVDWGYITKWVPQPPYIWEKGGEQRVANQVKEWLIASELIIVGVMASGSSGTVHQDGVEHWVVITGMSMDWQDNPWDERNWVRIYNPFDNETEYYPWEDLRNSWRNDGNMMVLIKPTEILDKDDLWGMSDGCN